MQNVIQEQSCQVSGDAAYILAVSYTTGVRSLRTVSPSCLGVVHGSMLGPFLSEKVGFSTGKRTRGWKAACCARSFTRTHLRLLAATLVVQTISVNGIKT